MPTVRGRDLTWEAGGLESTEQPQAVAPISSPSPPPGPERPESSSIPEHLSLSQTCSSLCCGSSTQRGVQVQEGHSEPSSQEHPGHQTRREGRGRPRRASNSLEVEDWGFQNGREGQRRHPGLAEPFAALSETLWEQTGIFSICTSYLR